MATPIKERGIKWQESYGDKSAPLKKSMEEQVGIGSYFRWEGYDHTTDTEYYVVVSPGYSEKKGYFFFAKAVLPRMREMKFGRIINIASEAG